MIPEEPIFLENLIEANLLQALLQEADIPHYVKAYTDPSRDGIWTFKSAWGHVECAAGHRKAVQSILEDLRSGRG